jgi:hypothetical protein
MAADAVQQHPQGMRCRHTWSCCWTAARRVIDLLDAREQQMAPTAEWSVRELCVYYLEGLAVLLSLSNHFPKEKYLLQHGEFEADYLLLWAMSSIASRSVFAIFKHTQLL